LAELRSLPRVSLTFMSPGMSPKDGAASRLASPNPSLRVPGPPTAVNTAPTET
jgi:hypothetical protein